MTLSKFKIVELYDKTNKPIIFATVAQNIYSEKEDNQSYQEDIIFDTDTDTDTDTKEDTEDKAIISIRWTTLPHNNKYTGFILQHVFYKEFEETHNYWEAWEIMD